MKIEIKSLFPDSSITHFVHSFWMLENKTQKDIPSTVLPNGMVDLIVMKTDSQEWEMVIRGIDTMSGDVSILSGTKMFSIGFKLLAVEYLFKDSIKNILNEGKIMANDYWQFDEMDLIDLESFCSKATQIINTIATQTIDSRKKKLFEHLYATDGSMSVNELSEKVFWNSRQINRYFNQTFGISLKTYCNILRFGASFKQISEGKIFPEQNFTDQNHFIKEIKKYAGVTPKELSKNKEGRFLNITAIKCFPF
ncbi:helix-turn-helix domain-containing protein [Flavobacterium restrictum]|uniref:Helix-turn-helix transcriptional regulator n=1 Tax=Flavobacterium restrictum TaxID=2594428 RepID=A0A553EDJ5_9FLAO|nr:AraC family transcriptional regulator [Flavobacterium restrictum]TRX43086.1 helix-turn-helix transcriptional regulator [Flavobacterium restrictum]